VRDDPTSFLATVFLIEDEAARESPRFGLSTKDRSAAGATAGLKEGDP
jgi:hypothetical protein